MSSTVHNRYEVSCVNCGVIEFTATKQAAIEAAYCARELHTSVVMIFDRMAHIGAAELWEAAEDGLRVLQKARAVQPPRESAL